MIDAKRPNPRHTIIKGQRLKRKTLKSKRKVSYQKVARWERGGREWVKR